VDMGYCQSTITILIAVYSLLLAAAADTETSFSKNPYEFYLNTPNKITSNFHVFI
jgi:hypothetical protein